MSSNKTKSSQERFLAAYGEMANISAACKASGVSRSCHYAWLASDEQYEARFADARLDAIDVLAAECFRRAVKGTTEHVYYLGCKVDSVQKYSDNLLMFMLKAAEPHKYRDNFRQENDAELTAAIAARLASLVAPKE